MNYKIFLKCRDLPLKPNEKAITMVIASYTGKDHESAFPSYETIHRQTQAGDDTIKNTIDLLRNIGILDYKNRADIMTGKQSNLYTFNFERINFNAKYLIANDERENLKQRITKERETIKVTRKKRARMRKKANKTNSNTLRTRGNNKSQNPYTGVRSTQGLTKNRIPPLQGVNTPSTRGRSIETVETNNHSGYRLAKDNFIKKNQKTLVMQEELMGQVQRYSQGTSNVVSVSREKKKPSEQTREEWLAEYDN